MAYLQFEKDSSVHLYHVSICLGVSDKNNTAKNGPTISVNKLTQSKDLDNNKTDVFDRYDSIH